MIDLGRECLLEDGEEGVGLAADRHREGQVLHPVGDVPRGQQLLAQLNLLKEKPLNSLLIGEVRESNAAASAAAFGRCFALLAQAPPEVRVGTAASVKVNAIAQECSSAQTGPYTQRPTTQVKHRVSCRSESSKK